MSWCILVNTTPKYMKYAEVQISCIRRYAGALDNVPIFLATELTGANSYVARILAQKNTHHIHLQPNESGFLESRIAAVNYILNEFDFILPLQEDFWLDRAPDLRLLMNALYIMETDTQVKSIRLMPSPGPSSEDKSYSNSNTWIILSEKDTYRFTFQATLWRGSLYLEFFNILLDQAKRDFMVTGQPPSEWATFCIRMNVAENYRGQKLFFDTCMGPGRVHLSVLRADARPNAVYLAPWPYRPTAVVQGYLEPWAKEFAEREGFLLD
jgi:hypothetical protein